MLIVNKCYANKMLKYSLMALLLIPAFVYAAETTSTDSNQQDSIFNGWSGEGELGFASTSGNTETESLNAKLGLTKEKGKWKHSASLESVRASTDDVTNVDRIEFKEKSEYKPGEKSYVFGKVRYEDDKFSGYDYQSSISFGAGSPFIKTDAHALDASAGIGYRKLKDTLTQETLNDAILTADAKYEYIISKTGSFIEIISIETGDENTHLKSETALKSKVSGNLASKISYVVKRNSDVPVGTEKTDKLLTVSLVYSF